MGRRGSSMNSSTRPVIFTDVRPGLPHFNRAWTGKCGLQRSVDSTKSGGFRISACDFSKTMAVVLTLLERNPFQGRAPQYLRAVLYRYRYSDAEARRRDGVWWTRERVADYSPVLSLDRAR